MSETVIEGNPGIAPPSPRRKRGWIAAGVAVVVVLGVGIALFSRGSSEVTVPPSDIYQIKAMAQLTSLSTTGTVAATSSVNMAFQNVGGTIKSINVKVGDKVKQGQVLATLDDSTLKAAVNQAQAGVSQAKGNLSQAQAHLAVVQQGATKQDIAVAQAAVTQAKTALVNAQKQYADAQAAYNNRSAQQAALTQAQNALSQAKTAYDTAQQNQATQIAAAQSALETAQTNLQTDQTNLQRDQVQYGDITKEQVQKEYQAYQDVLNHYNSWQQGAFAGTNPYAAQLQAKQTVYQSDNAGYQTLQGDQQKVSADQTAIASAKSQLTQAHNAVSQAKANYDAAQKALSVAEDNYNNRTQEQQQLDAAANAVKSAQAGVQQAEANLQQVQQPATPATVQAAQAAVQTAQAGVEAAKAQLQAAQLNESHATLKAPADGTITQKNNSVGDVVSPGQSVFVLDVSELQVQLSVSDTQLPYVKDGESISMTVSSLPGKTFSGKIFQVDPTPIPGNGNAYQVKASLNDPSNSLKPGMSGNVTIQVDNTQKSTLTVPTMALQQVNGVAGVYVVGKPQSGQSSQGQTNTTTSQGSGSANQSASSSGSSASSTSGAQAGSENLPSDVYFQPVVVGFQGAKDTEITNGLQPGEKILLGVGRFVSTTSDQNQ